MSNVRYLRVLTESGSPTYQHLSETEIHKLGLWHACVNVCVTDGYGNIYQQHRGGPPYTAIFPNLYDVFLASDHIVEQDEVPQEAVRRALAWRVGIELPYEVLRGLQPVLSTRSVHRVTDRTFSPDEHGHQGYLHRAFEHVYIIRLDGLCEVKHWPFPLQAGRVQRVRRYSIAQLAEDFYSPHYSPEYKQHVHRTPCDREMFEAIYQGVGQLTY